MSQVISRVLRSSCLHFVVTWFFQVRRLSEWSPRYLTFSAWGTTVWLMYTGGQCLHRRVNFMCEDLVSFIFSLHFQVIVSIVRRWSSRMAEANVGSGWGVKMAVSSAKILRIVVRLRDMCCERHVRMSFDTGQIKHLLDAKLCTFYFCRVTLYVSGVKHSSSGVLKNWHGGPWYRCPVKYITY